MLKCTAVTWRRALCMLVLIASACGDDDTATSPTTTTPPPATSSTTTTTAAPPPTTTTTAPADAPPPLIQTGEDFEAILLSIHEYVQWLAMHPDPALVAQVGHPGSQWEAAMVDSITALRDSNAAWNARQETLTNLQFVARPDPRVVSYSAIAETNLNAQAIDAAGNVVATSEGVPPRARIVVTLVQGDDGLWRRSQTDFLGPV